MATPQKKLERILESLICPICQEPCKLPKILPCNHMSCKSCLESWVAVRTKLICPQCNIEQALPSSGVSGLPDNFFARQISQDLQDFAVDEDLLSECEKHDELVTRVCQTCLLGVCQVCATQSHADHHCFDAGSSWRFIQEKMDKMQAELKARKEESRMVLTSLRQMKSFLDGKYHSAQRNIAAFKENLLQKVQELEEELNEELDSIYKAKSAELQIEMDKASEFERNVHDGLSSYSQIENATSSGKPCALNVATNQSFIKLRQLSSSLFMPKVPKGFLNLEFKPGLQFKFNPGEDCQVTCLPVPLDKIKVEFLNKQESPVQVKTHRKLQFRLILSSSEGVMEDADLPAVTANIHSPTGQTKDIGAYRQSDGTYMTTFFTPAHVGRYKMEIRIFNIPLKNSRQDMLVQPLGRHVNDFSGMDYPWQSPSDIVQWNRHLLVGDLAKNQIVSLETGPSKKGVTVMFQAVHSRSMGVHRDYLFICDPEANAIMKYSLVDKSLNLIYRHSSLESPRGVAVDSKGYLYVSDWVNHCILVFDEKAKMIGSHGSWGIGEGQLINPNFLAVNSKDQVIVADHGNHRLQIFDPVMDSFVRTIPVRLEDDSMYCCGIDVDSNDNIYISASSVESSDKLAIIVYTKDGMFLSSFSDGLHDDVDGLCITNNNCKLYVAARDSGTVSCFDLVAS